MWKKLSSNRDPGVTLYSEVKKEFGGYFKRSGNFAESIFGLYPKFFFGSMVMLMLISIVLAFTVFRHPGTPVKKFKTVNPVNVGFSQILQATSELKTTIRLKHTVDSITSKKVLSKADSTALESALDQLQRLHPKLK